MSIGEGWWIPAPPPDDSRRRRLPRRVLGVMGDVVRYGQGGNVHRMCGVKTFERWVRRSGAERKTET